MRVRRRRNITIGILCCMLVFMGIGYAALQQVLTINGTGNINGSWKIEITDISPESVNEGVSVSEEILPSKTEGIFTANLKKPTDAVIYTVTVENKGTIDAVLESITPEDHTSGDIKYTTTGKEECKNLDANTSCDFTIKVEYLDTGAGQVSTPNGTKVEQQFEIKYVQEGANVNTPGGVPGGGENPGQEKPAITVDSNGLVTGYNREKLTNDEGYVVIPSTTESGEKIVSVDRSSFAEYNASMTYGYNETTEEELQAIVIYDEENYDEIESIIVSMFSGEDSGSGSGSGSYSSNSSILGKDINPTNLVKNNKKNILLEKLSGSGSGGSDIPPIMSKTEFEALLKEFGSTEDIQLEHEYVYINLETGEAEESVSTIEKLDLTQAIHLKTIEEYAFGASYLKEIKFSDSIEEIGEYAFAYNSINGTLTLPKNLTELGDYAFAYNSINGTLTLPKNLTELGDYAFDTNQISGTLIIPDSLTNLGSSAFCSNQISRVEIGNGLTSIGSYAFLYNQLTEGVKFGSNLKTIQDGAFKNSKITGELVIPASIEQLGGNGVFANNAITSVKFEEGSKLTTIPSSTFSYNQITGELVIPANLQTIGDLNYSSSGAFQNNAITSIKFEEGSKLNTIGNDTFKNNQITNLEIANTVTSIGSNAFANNKIVDLSIPNNVTTLSSTAFDGESNLLTNVYIDIKNIKPDSSNSYTYNNIFNKNTIKNLTIGSNVESIASGMAGWNTKSAFGNCGIINLTFEDTEEKPSKLTEIGSNAFQGNQISKLTIPETVTTIGSYAFSNNQISNLTIPSSLTTINSSVFSNNKITNLTIPATVTTMGSNAFSQNQINELIFEDTEPKSSKLTTIEYSAFNNNKISSVTIPATVATIGDNAFSSNAFVASSDITIMYNDTNIISRFNDRWTTIGFPGSGPTGIKVGCYYVHAETPSKIIGYEIGDICSTDVEIPNELNGVTITTIGDNAFKDKGITRVVIPNTVTTIGANAFENNNITELVIPNSVRSIDTSAFTNTRITTLNIDMEIIPYGSAALRKGTFDNKQIQNLILGQNVRTIGNSAFLGNQINKLTVPSNVTTIGNSSFNSNNFTDASDITIEYDETNLITRFNSNWSNIGFPGSGPTGIKIGCYYLDATTPSKIIDYEVGDTCPTNIEIPSQLNGVTITTIGEHSFVGKGITSVIIPNSVTTIERSAFYNNNIINLIIPNSVTSIGDYAFDGENKLLTTLYIDMEIIPSSVFANYNSIQNLTIGSNVKTIGSHAFIANIISNLIFENTKENPSSLTTIGYSAFARNQITGELIIPASVIAIQDLSFNKNQITKVTIEDTKEKPSSLTSIERSAFSSNQITGELIIPSSVTTIGESAFYSNQITNLVIPSSVTTIEDWAFGGNKFDSSDDIIIEYNETNQIGRFNSNWNYIGFPGKGPERMKLGCYYLDANTPSKIIDYEVGDACPMDIEIPSQLSGITITAIGEYAFKEKGLKSVIIPNTVTTIERSAFENNQITELRLPSNLMTIGFGAFENNQITELRLPSNLVTIGEYAFRWNQITGELIIPSSLTTIEGASFTGNQITSLVFEDTEENPSKLTEIGGFSNNQITKLVIPSSVTTIESNAFQENRMTELIFEDTQENPSRLTTIGSWAFYTNQITGEVIIPPSVIEIGKAAFYQNNTKLTKIIIKRSDSTGMTLGDIWNGNSQVIYDPNYVG